MKINKLIANLLQTQVRITILFMLILTPFYSIAQKSHKFTLNFKLSINQGDLKDATITLFDDGTEVKKIVPEGNFLAIELDINSLYLITCAKPGYISKSIEFDTEVPAGRAESRFNKFKCEVELMPQPTAKAVKYKFPVGRIIFNDAENDFNYDEKFMSSVGPPD